MVINRNSLILLLLISVLLLLSFQVGKFASNAEFNKLIGFGILIVFMLIFLFKRVENSLLPLIIYIIIAMYLSIIIDAISPIAGRNLIAGTPGFIIPLAFLFLLFQTTSKEESILTTKIGKLIILYIIYFVLISFLTGGSFDDNRKVLQSGPFLMLFYFIGIRYFKNEKRIYTFFKVFLIFYIINGTYAFFQQIYGLPEFQKEFMYKTAGRITFVNVFDIWTQKMYYKVNGFSGGNYDLFYIITMLSIIMISSWKYFKEKLGKTLILSFLFVYGVLLIITLERGPIMMLGALPLAFLRRRKQFVITLLICIIIIITLSKTSTMIQSLGSVRLTRFTEIANPLNLNSAISGRFRTRWNYMIPMIFHKPFGIGVSYHSAVGAHNNYIRIFLQIGWFGGLLFLYILFKISVLCYKNIKYLKNAKYEKLIFGMVASMIAMLAIGIPNIPFTYDCAIFFWLFVALIEKLPEIYHKNGNLTLNHQM